MLAPFATVILIGLAGGLGAAARLGVYLFLDRDRAWPQWAILLVINLAGSLAIGYLAKAALRIEGDSREVLTGMMLTGFLGGFTTFSSFAIETTEGLHNRRARGAALFVALSLAGGVALAWLGQRMAS
ncbi:MAG: CrcB family protein [Planctomycetes bacterium]|nr:CrcB family protein [Planctomycetota bacterium]